MPSFQSPFIGSIDQGTTGTRFMIFDHQGSIVSSAYREHRQIFPQPGWVEHDPQQILQNVFLVMSEALSKADMKLKDLSGIGITNQRETTVLWDARTGEPVHNAIVWQDRRTASRCEEIKSQGWSDSLRQKTGLPIDPYFSATKIEWMLRNASISGRKLLFGTIDTWLIWALTGEHVTDVTNASRTLLFNLDRMEWDEELLKLFNIPREILPAVRSSSEIYGVLKPSRANAPLEEAEVPVSGDLGDQQAALFGQAGFSHGAIKNTYGTGSFLLRNTGPDRPRPQAGLLETVAYSLPGSPALRAIEGSIFVTGAAIQWLRDGLKIIQSAAETESLALSVPDTGGVYFVPALAGLGAPHWNPYARGTLVGLTRGTTSAHVVRATLEAIAYQTREVVEAMVGNDISPITLPALKVDGGAVKNNFLCQFQADILGVPVIRPRIEETTAFGAALAAGLAIKAWKDLDEISQLWKPDRTFEPKMPEGQRHDLYQDWKRAVRSALAWAGE